MSRAASVKCPNCGLLNPPGADWCDCGYNLHTGGRKCPNCGVANQPGAIRCICGYNLQTGEMVKSTTRTYEPVSSGPGSSILMGNPFLAFRTLITPTIVRILYFLGTMAITGVGILALVQSVSEPTRPIGPLPGSNGLVAGMVIIVIGNLLWRMLCEGIILFYSMHDVLTSIERELRRR